MATVGLTKDRKAAIQKNIQEMALSDRQLEFPDYTEESDIDASDYLTKLQFMPHLEVARLIPRDWLYKMEPGERTLTVLPREPKQVEKKHYYGITRETEQLAPLLVMRFPNAVDAYVRPTGESGYRRARPTILTLQQVRTLGADYYCPAHSQVLRNLDLLQRIDAHKAKWEGIEKQLMGLLEQATTVNMALRAFPELKLYLPQGILDKVFQQVEKKERPVVSTDGLDLDVLTIAGVANALSRRS